MKFDRVMSLAPGRSVRAVQHEAQIEAAISHFNRWLAILILMTIIRRHFEELRVLMVHKWYVVCGLYWYSPDSSEKQQQQQQQQQQQRDAKFQRGPSSPQLKEHFSPTSPKLGLYDIWYHRARGIEYIIGFVLKLKCTSLGT
jgi:hypothetical protein